MNCLGERATLGLAEEQVNMFGHHHVSVDPEREAAAHLLQNNGEQVVNCAVDEIGLAAITTEGDEMRLAGLLKPPQTAWHELNLHPWGIRVQ